MDGIGGEIRAYCPHESEINFMVALSLGTNKMVPHGESYIILSLPWKNVECVMVVDFDILWETESPSLPLFASDMFVCEL